MLDSGRRERNKLEKLSRILESARVVFAERGESAATTSEIADRADVAHSTLFRYAATKAELFIMVGNENLRLAIDRGIEAASADAAPLDRLQAFLSPVVGEGWTLPNLAAYQRRVLDESASGQQRDIALHMVEQIVGVVAGILEDAWNREEAAPATEPAARAIYAVIHVELLKAERDDRHRADFLTDIRAQAEIILRGYLATPNERTPQ